MPLDARREERSGLAQENEDARFREALFAEGADARRDLGRHPPAAAEAGELRSGRTVLRIARKLATSPDFGAIGGRALPTSPVSPVPLEHLWYGVKPPALRQPSFGARLIDNTLDVAGKIWTLPNTALGTAYGGLGTIAGLLAGMHPQIRFGHNAVEFVNNPLVDSKAAFTLGNGILYGQETDPIKIVRMATRTSNLARMRRGTPIKLRYWGHFMRLLIC